MLKHTLTHTHIDITFSWRREDHKASPVFAPAALNDIRGKTKTHIHTHTQQSESPHYMKFTQWSWPCVSVRSVNWGKEERDPQVSTAQWRTCVIVNVTCRHPLNSDPWPVTVELPFRVSDRDTDLKAMGMTSGNPLYLFTARRWLTQTQRNKAPNSNELGQSLQRRIRREKERKEVSYSCRSHQGGSDSVISSGLSAAL